MLRGVRSFLVQSGSMEPSIMTGDVVIITKSKMYFDREFVTFRDGDGRIVTHRILETKKTDSGIKYVTQGDANRSKDREEIHIDQILGKVALIIPKVGYVIAFAKSPPGLILIIGLPALIISIDEIKKIYYAIKKPKGTIK